MADNSSNDTRILVLGVGNILFTDEGIGVRCVEKIQQEYDASPNVELMDGGTLGTKLMDFIMNCDMLVVVDAVLGKSEPGSIYRFDGDELRKSLAFKNSLHQTDLVDTLVMCDLAGHRPDAVIIGMEPEDYHTMNVELSETAKARQDALVQAVIEEVEKHGGNITRRNT
ncbi:MAG: HyaD/HybD family hydrogenase maturation endopeptidase [Oceanidesulfovibrio sp.]